MKGKLILRPLKPGAGDIGATNIRITDIGATIIGITDIGATNIGITDIGATNIGITDIYISDLGDEVNPGDAQAAHHTQHHHKAPAHKTIPFRKKSQ